MSKLIEKEFRNAILRQINRYPYFFRIDTNIDHPAFGKLSSDEQEEAQRKAIHYLTTKEFIEVNGENNRNFKLTEKGLYVCEKYDCDIDAYLRCKEKLEGEKNRLVKWQKIGIICSIIFSTIALLISIVTLCKSLC